MPGETEVVLVTGATSGIGKACCERFLTGGARVLGVGRRRERLERMAAEHGPSFVPLPLDIRDGDAVQQTVRELPESLRRITVLINNAGLALGSSSFNEGRPDEWRTMIDTNITGLLTVTDAVVEGMMERNEGHIFNVGSVGGLYPAGSSVYGGTKAFVRHFSLALRRDLIGHAVRVTCVSPGSTATEFRSVRTGGTDEDHQFSGDGFAMAPGDVAEAIYMCNQLPARVNVNQIELMPVMQAFGGFQSAPKP